jgi:hypothetical protein
MENLTRQEDFRRFLFRLSLSVGFELFWRPAKMLVY